MSHTPGHHAGIRLDIAIPSLSARFLKLSQIPEPRWASLLCIKLLTYYLSALIFLNGHASKRAPPTIFPMVTISILFSMRPTERPSTRPRLTTKIPMFAMQCSNPLKTNAEIHITIIRNLPVSLFSLNSAEYTKTYEEVTQNCTHEHLFHRDRQLVVNKACEIIC